MTDWFLAAVPAYGAWLVAAVTYLSCLALPVPASIVMLAAGGFAAAGDLSPTSVSLAAFAGAVLGDQTGYWAARLGNDALVRRIAGNGPRAATLAKAQALIRARGLTAVFLSRWLISPLGPYANLITGATRYPWLPFTLAGFLGEAVWVGIYVGAGHFFGGNLEAATEFAGSLLGFLAAGAVALGLGLWLWHLAHAERAN